MSETSSTANWQGRDPKITAASSPKAGRPEALGLPIASVTSMPETSGSLFQDATGLEEPFMSNIIGDGKIMGQIPRVAIKLPPQSFWIDIQSRVQTR